MKAYILINTRIGAIPAVMQNLRMIAVVKSAEMVFGAYDIIAVVEVDDLPTLATVISKEIQTVPDVEQTTTCLAVALT